MSPLSARPSRVRVFVVIYLLALSSIVLSCKPSAQDSAEKDKLVIGAVLPMTGDAGTFGENAYNGALIAVSEANKTGGIDGRQIDLKVEDSRGTAEGAVAAAQKLIDLDKAAMLMGDVTSAGTHAIIPIAAQAKIPLISPSASDPALSNASPFFARVWPSDVFEAGVIGKYAKDKGYHKMASLYANTDYGVAMNKQLESILPSGMKLNIPVERETLDYRPSIQRIINAQVDAVFIVLYPEDGKRFLQQASEQGLSLPILATATIEDPSIASMPQASKLVFASPAPPNDSDQVRKNFVSGYKGQFNSDPGVVSDTAYDAIKILIEAARKKGSQHGSDVMLYVRSLQDYRGASGNLSFEASGDVRKPYRLRTAKGGEFVSLP